MTTLSGLGRMPAHALVELKHLHQPPHFFMPLTLLRACWPRTCACTLVAASDSFLFLPPNLCTCTRCACELCACTGASAHGWTTGCAQVRGRQLLASLLHGLEHTHVEVLDCRQAVLGVRRACRLGVQRAEAGERPRVCWSGIGRTCWTSLAGEVQKKCNNNQKHVQRQTIQTHKSPTYYGLW